MSNFANRIRRFISLVNLSFLIFFLFSCNQPVSNQNENKKDTKTDSSRLASKEIFIKTAITTENSSKKDLDSIISYSSIHSNYFEVALYSMEHGGYMAEKVTDESLVGEPFRMTLFVITDIKRNPIRFKSSTDFLNFMSEHDYNMVTEMKSKYRTDYTFKKN